MADKGQGSLFHDMSSSSEGNEQKYRKEIVEEEDHDEETDVFGSLLLLLEEIVEAGVLNFIPLMQEFMALANKIKALDKSLVNPLYNVSKDIQDLGRMILELAEEELIGGPENIVTVALRNGIRHESRLQMEQVDKDHSVCKVQPNPRKGIISEAIDTLIEIVVKLYYPNIELDPSLKGNFAPVREETTPIEALVVEGQIPETLNGMMIRNGPNPAFEPTAHYYWLDGDSMIHAIHFENGKATYVSRYVTTSRFKQEQYHGRAQFLQYGDLHGEFGLFMACMQLLKEKLGVLDMSHGWSNANTGVIYHNMLMILQDWDHPYAINVLENKDLYTLGINNYNKRLGHSVTPHSKKDPITGELFILGSSYTRPYASFSVVSKEGNISDPLPITTLSGPTYMHDFGLTTKYVIFMDLPFCYDPEKMLYQGTWIYSFQKKKSRFGILPRYAQSEEGIVWFEFNETFYIFHNGNSWEEDEDTLVLICLLMVPNTKMAPKESQTNVDPANRADDIFRNVVVDEARNFYEFFFKPIHLFGGRDTNVGYTEAKLCKLTFNMRTGEAKKKQLSQIHFEYPKVNEKYITRKSKFMYLSEMDKGKIPSIVKYNLECESETKLKFGGKKYGSEVTFVPRQSHTWLEEDDGYLTTFVHDEENSTSFAYVISAQKMEFLAMIELPNRVPYGFHATFVTKEEFQQSN